MAVVSTKVASALKLTMKVGVDTKGKDIFASVNGNLTGKKDAKIVTTDTSAVDVA